MYSFVRMLLSTFIFDELRQFVRWYLYIFNGSVRVAHGRYAGPHVQPVFFFLPIVVFV